MSQMIAPRRGRPKGTGIDDRTRLREIASIISQQPEIRPTTAIKLLGENDPSVIRRLRDKFHAMQSELMADLKTAVADQKPTALPLAEHASAARQQPSPIVPETVRPIETLQMREPARPESPPITPVVNTPTPPVQTPPAEPAKPATAKQAEEAAAKIAALSINGSRIEASANDMMAAVTGYEAARALDRQAAADRDPNPIDMLVGLTIEATVNAIEQQMRIYEQALRIPAIAMMVRNQISVSEALMNIACTAIRANRALAAASA